MMLYYVTVKNVTSTYHLGMLRIDCSGKTRLALHVPSSHELESLLLLLLSLLPICWHHQKPGNCSLMLKRRKVHVLTQNSLQSSDHVLSTSSAAEICISSTDSHTKLQDNSNIHVSIMIMRGILRCSICYSSSDFSGETIDVEATENMLPYADKPP